MQKETLLKFPCTVPVKIFGKNQESFKKAVREMVEQHFEQNAIQSITEHDSRHGSYAALTVNLYVESFDPLKELYVTLHECPEVLMTL